MGSPVASPTLLRAFLREDFGGKRMLRVSPTAPTSCTFSTALLPRSPGVKQVPTTRPHVDSASADMGGQMRSKSPKVGRIRGSKFGRNRGPSRDREVEAGPQLWGENDRHRRDIGQLGPESCQGSAGLVSNQRRPSVVSASG